MCESVPEIGACSWYVPGEEPLDGAGAAAEEAADFLLNMLVMDLLILRRLLSARLKGS